MLFLAGLSLFVSGCGQDRSRLEQIERDVAETKAVQTRLEDTLNELKNEIVGIRGVIVVLRAQAGRTNDHEASRSESRTSQTTAQRPVESQSPTPIKPSVYCPQLRTLVLGYLNAVNVLYYRTRGETILSLHRQLQDLAPEIQEARKAGKEGLADLYESIIRLLSTADDGSGQFEAAVRSFADAATDHCRAQQR